MNEQHPLSPAPSNEDELQYDLHHIARHNASTEYPQEPFAYGEGHPQHDQHGQYGSPAAQNYHYGGEGYQGLYNDGTQAGLGIHMDDYGNPMFYPPPSHQPDYLDQVNVSDP